WQWSLESGAVVHSFLCKQKPAYESHEIGPHVSEWERLLHPEDRPLADELYDRVVKRGARNYEGESRPRQKEGHYVPVLSGGFPVRRDPDGPVVRIVGTHLDLTERRQAEADRSRRELLARLVFGQEGGGG